MKKFIVNVQVKHLRKTVSTEIFTKDHGFNEMHFLQVDNVGNIKRDEGFPVNNVGVVWGT